MADCFLQDNVRQAAVMQQLFHGHWLLWESLFIHTTAMAEIALAINPFRTGMQTRFSVSTTPDTVLLPLVSLVSHLQPEAIPIANHLLDYILANYHPQPHCVKFCYAKLSIMAGLGRLQPLIALIGDCKCPLTIKVFGRACYMAAINGHLNIVEYLLHLNSTYFTMATPISESSILPVPFIDQGSATALDLSTHKTLIQPPQIHSAMYMSDQAFQGAISGGHIELVNVLLLKYPDYNLRPTKRSISEAVYRNHTNVIYYLLEPRFGFSKLSGFDSLFEIAGKYGCNELMDYAQKHQIGMGMYSLDSAGQLTTKKTIFSAKCECIKALRHLYARNGHTAGILQMKGGKHLLDKSVLTVAAEHGQLDTIHTILWYWAHHRPSLGVYSSLDAVLAAIKSRHVGVVMVLASVKIGLQKADLVRALDYSLEQCDFGIVTYLTATIASGRYCEHASTIARKNGHDDLADHLESMVELYWW
ncbi:hypothetical protein RTP6_003529 [Batrachochytrium dendrobatidis]